MGTGKSSALKKNYIWNKINSQGMVGLGYIEEKLIAEFILDCNTSHKTAVEFLKAFEIAERIIRKDGRVYSKAFFNDDLTLKENLESIPTTH